MLRQHRTVDPIAVGHTRRILSPTVDGVPEFGGIAMLARLLLQCGRRLATGRCCSFADPHDKTDAVTPNERGAPCCRRPSNYLARHT